MLSTAGFAPGAADKVDRSQAHGGPVIAGLCTPRELLPRLSGRLGGLFGTDELGGANACRPLTVGDYSRQTARRMRLVPCRGRHQQQGIEARVVVLEGRDQQEKLHRDCKPGAELFCVWPPPPRNAIRPGREKYRQGTNPAIARLPGWCIKRGGSRWAPGAVLRSQPQAREVSPAAANEIPPAPLLSNR